MRKRYQFDDELFVECTSYTLYTTHSGEFSYLTGGRSNGCRVLVETSPNGEMGTGRLHDDQTVNVADETRARLARAMRRAANAGVRPLLDVANLPLFRRDGDWSIHQDEWYTRSRFSIEIDPPAWAGDGARAFDLAEGIYVVFDDQTYRLVPKREYFVEQAHLGAPDGRQGDLLVYKVTSAEAAWHQRPDRFWSGCHRVGRHSVVGSTYIIDHPTLVESTTVWLSAEVSHPEHDSIVVQDAMLVMAPGTSRPFQLGVGDTD
jgi:hypothetical protein